MNRLLCVVAMLSIGAFAVVWADDGMVPLDKLPKRVVEALKKQFPKAELLEASKETEDGKTEYEVTIKEGGTKIAVTLSPEGTILGLEKEMAMKDLPKAVMEIVEGKYPKATYKTVEGIFKIKDGKEIFEHYEMLLVTADKKMLEINVTTEGKITKTEEKKNEKEEK
jgi:3-keto-L-gulonate-6-phosphate decarboxylase